VGSQELWLSGHDAGYWQAKGHGPDTLILVWVDGVDALHQRVIAAGVEAPAPEDKPYGVRSFTVADPAGYRWDFIQPLAAAHPQAGDPKGGSA
jgi:uncharacterized glyoxalase superfamily protein PhnB